MIKKEFKQKTRSIAAQATGMRRSYHEDRNYKRID